MRRGEVVRVPILVGLLLVAGCAPDTHMYGGCYCTTHSYDAVDVGPVVATGTVDWSGDWPVVDADPPPFGACHAYLAASSSYCRDGTLPVDVSLTVLCEENKGYRPVTEATMDLGDIRELGPGDHPVANGYWYGSPVHCTLRVESTSGSSLPYPQIVTQDFDKLLRFRIIGTDALGAGIDASLELDLKASDFRALPSQSCEECAC